MKGVQLRAETRAAIIREIIQKRRTLDQTASEFCVDIPTVVGWIDEYIADSRFALEARAGEVLSAAGLQTENLTDLEFSGSLEQITFPDVLQLMIMHRRSCVVRVGSGGGTGKVWLRDGDVFDAEFDELVGERAFFSMLSLRQGTFRVLFHAEDRIRSIHRGTQALILEAAKRSDEANEMQERVGGAAQVYERSDRSLMESVQLRPQDMKTLALFDAKRNLDEILRASPIDEYATLTQITRLVEEGYLVPSSVKPVAVSLPVASQRVFARASLILGDNPGFSALPTALSVKNAAQPRRLLLLGALASVTVLSVAFAAVVDHRISAPYATKIDPVKTPIPAAAAATVAVNEAKAGEPAPATAQRCPKGLQYFNGGEFHMGSTSALPALRTARPEHAAKVAPFCLDVTEVSVGDYEGCVAKGACPPARDNAYWPQGQASKKAWITARKVRSTQCNTGKASRTAHPINCVGFVEARTYCAAQALRLPTEAEWEFAARGAEGRKHPWGNTNPNAATVNACGAECEVWHRGSGLLAEFAGITYAEDDGYPSTAPVGVAKAGATPEGVLDLVGNVSEWTSDAPSDYPNAPSKTRSADSAVHMLRGAAFSSGPAELTDAAFRFPAMNDTYSPSVGFRCAGDAN